jgi:hypothetical protein
MTDGIYTLANDVVYDQLVALLNSIEANAGQQFPVYVIAYDDKLERIQAEIATRPNVFLLNDPDLFKRWEDFSLEVWKAHPTALSRWQEQGICGVNRIGMNRRYCAFDPTSPLDRFAYLDADTLVLGPLEPIFTALDTHEFVTYDFQYKDPTHIYNVQSSKLLEVFDENRLKSEIFCAGFYASKRGFLGQEQREWLVSKLQEGEAEILYTSAPNQSVLNYMVMRSQIPVHNLALHWSEQQRTGNSVTSSHFQMQDNILYDRGKRLTYLHYIGVSSSLFRRLCAGENVHFPYRDVFLHYRYLHKPEERPQVLVEPKPPKATFNLAGRVLRKIGLSR